MTEPLSPTAAAAVLDAFLNGYICRTGSSVAFESDRNGLAAALRAAVEHCVPDYSEGHWVYIPHVLDIAAELEVTNG